MERHRASPVVFARSLVNGEPISELDLQNFLSPDVFDELLNVSMPTIAATPFMIRPYRESAGAAPMPATLLLLLTGLGLCCIRLQKNPAG